MKKDMKLKITVLAVAFVAFLTACDDFSLLNYDLNFASASVTIGSTEVGDTTYVEETEFLDPKGEMDKVGVDASAIKEATIKTIKLVLKSPETGNFDWARSASVTVMDASGASEEIASVDNVADGLTEIELTGLGVDLTQYLQGGEFKFKVTTTTDAPIAVDHEVIVETTFNVSL